MYNERKILYTARGCQAECSIENFEFIVHSESACICKQNTNLTVSNVLASKSYTLTLTKQNKTNAILKTLYAKKYNKFEELY